MIDAPQQLLAVIDEIEGYSDTRDDAWQIPREEGELLYDLVVRHGWKSGVEVGTSYGFSGLFWGAALLKTGGALHTIDINPKKTDHARATFKRAGLGEVITCHLGDARQVLASIPGPLDFAFLDAAKEQTQEYFDQVWPKIRAGGGAVLTDNITTHEKQMADYLAHLRGLKGATTHTHRVGNGVEVTIKR